MSVCESRQIEATLELHDTVGFLSNFGYLNISKVAMIQCISFMKTYTHLPNDALILATCKLENILVLASYDSDFFKACQK